MQGKNADRRCLLLTASTLAVVAFVGAPALAQPAAIYDMAISRNSGCTCCHAWSEALRRSGRFRTTLTDAPDMAALKRRLGVPDDLASCHTGVVDDYAIEGHVPVEDVLRLLRERPAGVRGLAVRGMPLGAPGMEQPNGAHERFDVIAFRAGGARSIFASHAAG